MPYLAFIGIGLWIGTYFLLNEYWRIFPFYKIPGPVEVVTEWLSKDPIWGTSLFTEDYYINIWDLDDAAIGASSTQLCYPDTTVQLSNLTEKNCTANGNTSQRFEKWNFGDLDNNGMDDIIDWRPWVSSAPFDLDLPGVGTYYVMLYDSSYSLLTQYQLELTFQQLHSLLNLLIYLFYL